MKKIIKLMVVVSLVLSMVISFSTTAKAFEFEEVEIKDLLEDGLLESIQSTKITFKDLKSTHWAFESVDWGVSEGIVKGYPDGTYKPNEQIIESEFVTILSRYLNDLVQPDNTKASHWSQKSYEALRKYELPLRGYDDLEEKHRPLTRGRMAQILAAQSGFNLDERQAVYYMYENKISLGLSLEDLSFESYGKDLILTRAQIPAFFQRLHTTGVTKFDGVPSVVNSDKVAGIHGVLPSDKVITDEMFYQLNTQD